MKFVQMTPELYDYVLTHSPLPHPELAELGRETARLTSSRMQSPSDQVALMNVLAKAIGAKRCLEFGCFTGYSALGVAAGLPEDGKLITLDIDPETAKLARHHIDRAGLGKRVEIRLGPAVAEIERIEREFGTGSFDMAFIDADKTGYDAYYEASLKLVRRGGLILIDNVLWGGSVVDRSRADADTLAIRALNDKVARDERVDRVMVTVSDGLYVCRKR